MSERHYIYRSAAGASIASYVASGPDDAARLFAREWYGATARRTTGERGKTGWFRAYRQERDGTLNSVGEAFHVH